MRGRTIALAMMTMFAGPAAAQDMAGMDHGAPVDCSVVRMALPPELAAWGRPHAAATAANDKAGLKKATLAVDTAVDARLIRTSDIRYVMRPEKPGGSVSYGGLFAFSVPTAGTYRVALGSGAWIDLLKDGKPVESSRHGHGPDCTGVRKMVDFPLTPGRHVLQLAANGSETLTLLVTRLP